MDGVERHHDLLQQLHVGIIVHAPDTQIVFCNRRASELLGLSPEQIQGKVALDPAWRFINEEGETVAPADYPVNRVIATGMPLIDLVLGVKQSAHHKMVWASVSAFPECDGQGRLKRVVVNFYEISQLKEAEQRLKERATQLSFVLEGAELGFWDWNLDTGAVDRNEQWAAMLGYSHQEIQQTTRQWSDFVHPDDKEAAWQSINAVLAGRSPIHKLEYRMLHKDGSVRWILDQAKVMQRDALGKPVRMCGIHADVTERKLLEEALTRQAQIDYVTGLFNRRHFMEVAEQERSRALRYGDELSIFMMDIDCFKQINDCHGHNVGDRVLQKVAEVCLATLRTVDIPGRVGGEEFAILLPATDRSAALEVAERLNEAIAAAGVPLPGGRPVRFTISIGVASMSAGADSIDALLNLADKALYAAKNSGRNRVCVAGG